MEPPEIVGEEFPEVIKEVLPEVEDSDSVDILATTGLELSGESVLELVDCESEADSPKELFFPASEDASEEQTVVST